MGEPDRMDLCKPCAVAMSHQGIRLKVASGRTEKIACAKCGRRRYGQTYEATTNTKEEPRK